MIRLGCFRRIDSGRDVLLARCILFTAVSPPMLVLGNVGFASYPFQGFPVLTRPQ